MPPSVQANKHGVHPPHNVPSATSSQAADTYVVPVTQPMLPTGDVSMRQMDQPRGSATSKPTKSTPDAVICDVGKSDANFGAGLTSVEPTAGATIKPDSGIPTQPYLSETAGMTTTTVAANVLSQQPAKDPSESPSQLELSDMLRDAVREAASSAAKISVLSEEDGAKMLNTACCEEHAISGMFTWDEDSTGKPVRAITNFRIFENEDVTALYPLGINSRSSKQMPSNLCALATLVSPRGTVMDGCSRVRLSEVNSWKISYHEGLEGSWIGTKTAWYRLLEPDSSYRAVYEDVSLRVKLCQSIVQQLKEHPNAGILAVARKLCEDSSGAASDTTEWWLWRMRQERAFITAHLHEHHPLEQTTFGRVVRDIIFSNIPCSYPAASKNLEIDANPYSAIWTKYLDQKQSGYSALPIPGTDSEDQEAVRKLTDRHVMVTRGKYRGRTGNIIGAGKGNYIVNIDGEGECQVKGAYLELHDEDIASSGEEEAFEDHGDGAEEVPAAHDVLLSHCNVKLDPDFEDVTGTRLVQRRVIIRDGKLSGQIGVVTSSGHGFYCIRARGTQVKLRRREFEVCEDDPSEDAVPPLHTDASAGDTRTNRGTNAEYEWIGKKVAVRVNGRHKGKQGTVVAYTVGILTIAVGEERVLSFPEDVEELEPPPRRVNEQNINTPLDSSALCYVGSTMNPKVTIKSGKYEGMMGTVISVDHGWHYILLDGNEEIRVRSKDIIEECEECDTNTENPVVRSEDAHGTDLGVGREQEEEQVFILAGKFEGQIGVLRSVQANGWYSIELTNGAVCLRQTDFEVCGGKAESVMVDSSVAPAGEHSVGSHVIIVGGKHDGKVGQVSRVFSNSWHCVNVQGQELRVRMRDLREYSSGTVADEPGLSRMESSESCLEGDQQSVKPVQHFVVKAGKYKGQTGIATESAPGGWTHLQLQGEAVRVRSSDCEFKQEDDHPGPAKGMPSQSDNDAELEEVKRQKRGRGDDEVEVGDDDDLKVGKLKRPRQDDDDDDLLDDESTHYEMGSTVKVRLGEHAGKVGQIVKTGHGWINVKVDNEEVRVRSKDIEVIPTKTMPEAADSPVTKITVKSGKYRGQVGNVLSSGHGWLWVKLGTEEIRVRRRDVVFNK